MFSNNKRCTKDRAIARRTKSPLRFPHNRNMTRFFGASDIQRRIVELLRVVPLELDTRNEPFNKSVIETIKLNPPVCLQE